MIGRNRSFLKMLNFAKDSLLPQTTFVLILLFNFDLKGLWDFCFLYKNGEGYFVN